MREFSTVINSYNERNNFLLEVSIMNGEVEGVKEALKAGVDQYYPATDTSYIVIAAQKEQWEIVDLLIEDGFNVNVDNQFGHSVLHWACQSAPVELVEKLLNYGASTSAKNKRNETPIFIAAKHNRLDIVDLMLDQLLAPSVFIKDKDYKTMLHHCAEKNYQEMFSKLWFHGVDLYALDKDNKSATDYIQDEFWKAELPQLELSVNEELKAKGIDPKAQSYNDTNNEDESIKIEAEKEKARLAYTLKAYNGISHIIKKATVAG